MLTKKNNYSTFFAPPKFLEMCSVSIEILSTGIYYLVNKRTSFGVIPDKYGFVPLPAGVVSGGEIINQESLVRALVEIRKKTSMRFVRFSLPEEKTYIFKTHLPNLKPEEIRDVLEFKLEENIPLSSKEAVFDFDVIRGNKKDSGLDVVVSAASLKIISCWETIFNLAGLTPVLFSPESDNLVRAVVRPGNQQSLIVVNIKDLNTVMSLVVSGNVYQTSSINLGGLAVRDLLVKYYKTTIDEATKIIDKNLYTEGPEALEVFAQIVNVASTLSDEINKFISYCNERADIVTQVDRLILCGPSATIVGLTKYLSARLNIPVDIANVWLNNFDLDDYLPELDRREALNYATVNGLNLI